jgi:Winged helix DNA-binding domain
VHAIPTAERRGRLAARHLLSPPARADSAVDVARALVCLHATDAATVYLSAWARLRDPTVAAVDAALYEDRSLLRMLAMRRTVFVAPIEDAPILQAATTDAIAVRERKRTLELVELLGVPNPAAWLRSAEAEALAALERLGEATAQELAALAPALQAKVRVNVGKKYEGVIGMSSRVLFGLAAEGRIVRVRPRGSWVSSQHRWATTERWLGGPLPTVPIEQAQAALIGRWLARFGPGTEADVRWWTGLTARDVRRAFATVGAVEVALDDGAGYVLPDDLATTPVPEPWVALLPALDPTTMGWQARDWYLGPHKAQLFDSTGNAGSTIWSDGRIVGGWAVRANGEVVTKLLEDVGRDVSAAVASEAARLTEWLQSVRVAPRFPTALQKELVD